MPPAGTDHKPKTRFILGYKPWLARCGLTTRSSGAPTACHAGHQALGLRPILRLLSSAPCRRRPLSSNVRPRNHQIQNSRRTSCCRRPPASLNGSLCALRAARLRPLVSSVGALKYSARRSGRCRQIQMHDGGIWDTLERLGVFRKFMPCITRGHWHQVSAAHMLGRALALPRKSQKRFFLCTTSR